MILREESTSTAENLTPAPSRRRVLALLASLWDARGFFGGLIALGLAVAGQLSLMQPKRDPNDGDAKLCYLAAFLVLIISLLRPTLKSRRTTQHQVATDPSTEHIISNEEERSLDEYGQIETWNKANDALVTTRAPFGLLSYLQTWRARAGGRTFQLGLAALTLVLTAATTMVMVADIRNPVGGWLWVATVLALVATSIWVQDPARGDSLLPGPGNDFYWRGQPRIAVRWEAALVVIILCVALALRLWNLENHPVLFGDEGMRGLSARAINEGGTPNIFGFGWWGVPNLYFYCVAWLMRIFGDNVAGDRLLSAISGLVAVWYLYRSGRLLWGPRAGLLAGTMLAVSTLALQFSRTAGESTPTGALWAGGFFYLLMALKYRRWSDWVLSGVIFGLSLYTYASAKLIAPILVLVTLYCLVRWRAAFIRRYALGFILMGFAFTLVFMPNAISIFADKEGAAGFTGRAQETSIFTPANQQMMFEQRGVPFDPNWAQQPLMQSVREHPISWAQFLFGQLASSTDVIYKVKDATEFYKFEGEHNGTMLPPLWAALVLLGLAYAAWKVWDPRFGLTLIWFWGGMLAVALTINTPAVQRITGAWPALMLFPAALLDRIFASAWPLSVGLARRWATLPLAGLLVYFAYSSYQEYFVYYPSVSPKFWDTYARHVQSLGQDFKVYQLSDKSEAGFDYGVVRFMAKGVEGKTVAEPVEYLPVTDNHGKGVAFLAMPQSAQYLPLIQQFYPGGKEEAIKDVDGKQQFVSYKLTRQQMEQFQAVHATYHGQNGQTINRDEANLGAATANPDGSWLPPPVLTYPAKASWQGGLVAPTYGVYTLRIVGGDDARLEIDGKAVLDMIAPTAGNVEDGTQIDLVMAKGMHSVRFSGTLHSLADHLEVQWAVPNQPAKPIPAGFLFSGTIGGLSGEIAPNAKSELLTSDNPYGGQPIQERRTYPAIGLRGIGNLFGATPPATVRWQGVIRVPTTGTYTFDLSCYGASVLMIDDKAVVAVASSGLGNTSAYIEYGDSQSVKLTEGKHKVDLRYAWEQGGAQIELFWTPPGKERTLVPPDVLIPQARSWSPEEVAAPPARLEP